MAVRKNHESDQRVAGRSRMRTVPKAGDKPNYFPRIKRAWSRTNLARLRHASSQPNGETEMQNRNYAPPQLDAVDPIALKLSHLWHSQVGAMMAAGVSPALVRESMLAAALVQAVQSEGSAAVINRLRDAADAFERDLLAGDHPQSPAPPKISH